METITYCFFGFLVAVYIGLRIKIYMMNEELKKKLAEIRRLRERNRQIRDLYFKVNLFGIEALKQLPDHDTLLYTDTKEVTVKNYVEIDAVVNLN